MKSDVGSTNGRKIDVILRFWMKNVGEIYK